MAKKPRVYVETSVVSYLTARPSRDVVVAGHQQVTRDWWSDASDHFDCFVSAFVLEEAAEGDPQFAKARLAALEPLTTLETTDEARSLAMALVSTGVVPIKATLDAFHLAMSAVHRIDYLVTWNCRHLANALLWPRFAAICRERSLILPVICTPEALQE